MAVNTVKSDNVTNIEADPVSVLDKKRGEKKVLIDTIEVVAEDLSDIGDVILFGPVPSNAVLTSIKIYNDDLDAGATLACDVGLYYSGIGGDQEFQGNTSGTVLDADAYATAITVLQGAVLVGTEVRYEVDDIANVGNEAWQDGGLSEDPGGALYVGLTLTAAATTPAAGTITLHVEYLG